MKIKKNPVLSMLFFSGLFLLIILIMQPLNIWQFGEKIVVLFPKGMIALEQRNLLFILQALMLIIIIPVYILTFVFSWIYRADNPKGKYDPDLVDNTLAECVWWGLPLILVIIASVLTWVKTHELDPYKSIESENKEIKIQVVALQWKWLFIYPEEKIATIDFIQIPENTPVQFELTADAPMNSFWIPALGGQIYAMPAMTTFLNLIANEKGDFRGSSAHISGEGFSRMNFVTRASTKEDYDKWVSSVKQSGSELNLERYNELAKPALGDKPLFFQLTDETLFDDIVNKFMHPKP